MNQLNAYFNSLDKENTGMIKIEDVLKKFEEMKFQSSRITVLRELYDKNQNMQISYSDFLTRALDITREVEQDDLLRAFQHFDTDGSGKITKEDLKDIMKRKGENLNDEQLNELINQVDGTPPKDKNIKDRTEINFETFKNYIYKLSPMSPSMRQIGGNIRTREENYSIDAFDDNTPKGSERKNTDGDEARIEINFEEYKSGDYSLNHKDSSDFQVILFDNE